MVLTLMNSAYLSTVEGRLSLCLPGFSPLSVDFSRKSLQKRRDAGKKQGLVRACKPMSGIRIIDATAGWGRDAAILASFGAEVLMLERQPIMASLLSDGLMRRLETDNLSLSLLPVDALSHLMTLPKETYPDVIYIDPMHPVRQKSALVKKEMQALQQLFGSDDDVLALINCAVLRIKQRVVVKWPQRLPSLLTPQMSFPGKTVRFDVYWPR